METSQDQMGSSSSSDKEKEYEEDQQYYGSSWYNKKYTTDDYGTLMKSLMMTNIMVLHGTKKNILKIIADVCQIISFY